MTPRQAEMFGVISRDLEAMRDLVALGLALGEEPSLVASLRAVAGVRPDEIATLKWGMVDSGLILPPHGGAFRCLSPAGDIDN